MNILLIGIIFSLGEITQSVYFSEDELSFKDIKSYQLPLIKDCNFVPNPGEPQIPIKAIYFVLPQGSRVKGVRVIDSKFKILPDKYNLYPSQPPQILSTPGGGEPKNILFVNPVAEIYSSSKEYPGKLIEFMGEGRMGSYRIAEVLVYPLQWVPKAGELKIYTEIRIAVELAEDKVQKFKELRVQGSKVRGQIIRELVINPAYLDSYQGAKYPTFYEYLIITSSELDSILPHLRAGKP